MHNVILENEKDLRLEPLRFEIEVLIFFLMLSPSYIGNLKNGDMTMSIGQH